MVVIDLPASDPTGSVHERTAAPATSTVQAPQRPAPHPYLEPVSRRSSRSTHSNGFSGSTSTLRRSPLTESAMRSTGISPPGDGLTQAEARTGAVPGLRVCDETRKSEDNLRL